MTIDLSRRDLFLAAGGAGAGLLLSPVPWKLLDDLAILTQTPPFPWPRPAGPLAFRKTACSLCPAGCGLSARCFGDRVVSLAGIPGHPVSDGAVCPLGLTAHHLPLHPLRAKTPQRREAGGFRELAPDAAVALAAGAVAAARRDPAGGTVAVVDGRPGSGTALAYRALAAAVPGARYALAAAAGPARTLEAVGRRFEKDGISLGSDLTAARRVLCFGTPLLEGWGVPGLLARRRADRAGREPHERLSVIQVDSCRTRSASLADRWLPIREGGETALALGLCRVLVDEGLGDASFVSARTRGSEELAALVARLPLDAAAERSGIPEGVVVALARELAASRPVAVLGGGDPAGRPLSDEAEAALAALSLLLGSPGTTLVPRRPLPAPAEGGLAPVDRLEALPSGFARLVLVDGSVPEGLVPDARLSRLLVPGGLVVALAPFRAGLAASAGLLLPTPAPLEEPVEVFGPAEAPTPVFAVAPAVTKAPEGVVPAAEWVSRIATAAGLALAVPSPNARLDALVAARRGRVVTPGAEPAVAADAAAPRTAAPALTAAALENAFAAGGCWVDDPPPPLPPGRFRFFDAAGEADRLLAAALATAPGAEESRPCARESASAAPPSPLLAKLEKETALRRAPEPARPWRA